MKRSDINLIVKDAIATVKKHHFHLPPWAYWTLSDWQERKADCSNIFREKLGWDVTDMGGDFSKLGLVLFTIRNGILHDTKSKSYAEKIILMRKGQICPMHYHMHKMEDIINRGETKVVFELCHSTKNGDALSDEVEVLVDAIPRTVGAREKIYLNPGESITLVPGMYHAFYTEEDNAFIGEVSKVNDDENDNVFLTPMPRFPSIVEDEPKTYLLVNDYRSL